MFCSFSVLQKLPKLNIDFGKNSVPNFDLHYPLIHHKMFEDLTVASLHSDQLCYRVWITVVSPGLSLTVVLPHFMPHELLAKDNSINQPDSGQAIGVSGILENSASLQEPAYANKCLDTFPLSGGKFATVGELIRYRQIFPGRVLDTHRSCSLLSSCVYLDFVSLVVCCS